MIHGHVGDLKAAQINMKSSLIRELILYEFKLGHNATETAKNICYVKGEGTVDHRWFKKFCSVCKTFDDQERSDKSKTVYSEAILKAIKGKSGK